MDTSLNMFGLEIVFLNPEYLDFIPVAVICFLLFFAIFTWKRLTRPKKTRGSRYPVIGRFKFWFFANLMLVMIIVALARPVTREGVVFEMASLDVIVLIDGSISMRANDLDGLSRLDVAKREVVYLVDGDILKSGDRVALFEFNKISKARLPFADDFSRFRQDVSNIHFHERCTIDESIWGTDLVSGLNFFIEVLDLRKNFDEEYLGVFTHNRTEVVLLFTDGDESISSREEILEVANTLHTRGIKVYSVGVGTSGGVPVVSLVDKCSDSDDLIKDFVSNFQGEITRLETDNLSLIAKSTGGDMVVIDDESDNISDFLRSSIDENRSKRPTPITEDDIKFDLWPYLVWASVAVLFIAILIF